jgi:hypothetical protein
MIYFGNATHSGCETIDAAAAAVTRTNPLEETELLDVPLAKNNLTRGSIPDVQHTVFSSRRQETHLVRKFQNYNTLRETT